MLNFFTRRKRTTVSTRAACQRCGSGKLKRTLATFPVMLTGKLKGKRVDVYRVEHNLCRDCGFTAPTPDGHAKIKRCTKTGINLFMQHLP